ncbi:MAG: hypothetical protein IPM46_05670 [Flavobacteriales bacterium]|nr:hypothetical protein [Flavobacteriales bacterium]
MASMVIVGGLLVGAETEGAAIERYSLTNDEVALLQDGDLILRRGHGWVSDVIANVLKEEYDLSHCGIIAEHEGGLWVIHSVSNSVSDSDGMQAHRLQAFVSQSKHGSVVVTRLRTDRDRSGIALRAKHYLRRKVPFDHRFDRNDTTSLFCSELIARILQDGYGLAVFDSTESDLAVSGRFMRFLDSERFEMVLDHQKH